MSMSPETTETTEEIERRIAALQDSGMHMAAKALMRELHQRQKREG